MLCDCKKPQALQCNLWLTTISYPVVILALIFSFSFFAGQQSSAALIDKEKMIYKGAFRVPGGNIGFSYSGSVLALAGDRNSLFITGKVTSGVQPVAEISIVAPVIGEIDQMHTAQVIQDFSDPVEGNLCNIGLAGATVCNQTGSTIGGLYVRDNDLLGSVYSFYDAGGVTHLSHFLSGTTLNQSGDFNGFVAVDNSKGISFTSGWIAEVPVAWQQALGGDLLIGQGGLSIISRTSYGPSAFSADFDDFKSQVTVQASPLLYYDSANNVNGYTNEDGFFNGTTKIAGMVIIEDSLLFFGFHGIGEYNYGTHTDDPRWGDECTLPDVCEYNSHGVSICSDQENCTTGRKGLPYDPLCPGTGSDGCYYDPSRIGAKGPHAYPYIYQVWAYSLHDLASVKLGNKNPYDLRPYAIWEMPYEYIPSSTFPGAAAYDAEQKRLYVVQPGGELMGCCEKLPLIHVFEIDPSQPSSSHHTVGGKLYLTEGEIKITLNATEELTLNVPNRNELIDFRFSSELAKGSQYSVRVSSNPSGYSCQVFNGDGTVTVDTSNIAINCMFTGSPDSQQKQCIPPLLWFLLDDTK